MDYIKLFFYFAGGKLRRIFFMALPENEIDYVKSRRAFVAAECANQTIAQFVSGTFLVSVLTYLGVSDGGIGTVISITTLATLFDLFTMNYVQHLQKRKLFVCLMVLQKVWFAYIYFIPFFDWTAECKIFVFIFFLTFSQICLQISTPAINDWIGEMVSPRTWGEYFSRKDAAAVFVTVSSMLIMGMVFDRYKADQHLLSYPILGKTILCLSLIDFLAMAMMKEPRKFSVDPQGREMHGILLRRNSPEEKKKTESTLEGIHRAFAETGFRKALLLTCLWNMAYYIAQPFNTSYQLKELDLSFTYIMVVNFIANMVRIAVMPIIGKKADRIGRAKMLSRVLTLFATGYYFMMMAVPENGQLMFTVSTFFNAVSWCFISIGLLCIQLEFLNQETRMFEFALLTAISGVFGFLVSAVTGRFLNHLQTFPAVISGHVLYAQQVTNFLGIIMTCVVILFLKRDVECMEGNLRDNI